MIVLPTIVLRQLMTDIVGATHGLGDDAGEAHICATISESTLRMAAITAIQIATGETVWPGDRTITIKRRKIDHGVFREE